MKFLLPVICGIFVFSSTVVGAYVLGIPLMAAFILLAVMSVIAIVLLLFPGMVR